MKHTLLLTASLVSGMVMVFGFRHAINILFLILAIAFLICDLHFYFDKWEWAIKLISPITPKESEEENEIKNEFDITQEDFDTCYHLAIMAQVEKLL